MRDTDPTDVPTLAEWLLEQPQVSEVSRVDPDAVRIRARLRPCTDKQALVDLAALITGDHGWAVVEVETGDEDDVQPALILGVNE